MSPQGRLPWRGSPGAASGVAVFDPDTAVQRSLAGENVILVRDETTPEDFHGIVADAGATDAPNDHGAADGFAFAPGLAANPLHGRASA